VQDFAHHGLPHAPLVPGHAPLEPGEVLLLHWAPLAHLHAPVAPDCGYPLPAACFPSQISAKNQFFFS